MVVLCKLGGSVIAHHSREEAKIDDITGLCTEMKAATLRMIQMRRCLKPYLQTTMKRRGRGRA